MPIHHPPIHPGVHTSAVFVYVAVYSLLAVLNHYPFDIEFRSAPMSDTWP